MASVLGKTHSNVKISAERLAAEGSINSLNSEQFSHRGNTYFEYQLSKLDSLILTVKLSPKSVKALLSEWEVTTNKLQEILKAFDAFDVPKELAAETWLYAIQEKETGKVKLGISQDPQTRVKQLQIGNPNTLELVVVRKAEQGLIDETNLHLQNHTHHIRGEWFHQEALLTLQ